MTEVGPPKIVIGGGASGLTPHHVVGGIDLVVAVEVACEERVENQLGGIVVGGEGEKDLRRAAVDRCNGAAEASLFPRVLLLLVMASLFEVIAYEELLARFRDDDRTVHSAGTEVVVCRDADTRLVLEDRDVGRVVEDRPGLGGVGADVAAEGAVDDEVGRSDVVGDAREVEYEVVAVDGLVAQTDESVAGCGMEGGVVLAEVGERAFYTEVDNQWRCAGLGPASRAGKIATRRRSEMPTCSLPNKLQVRKVDRVGRTSTMRSQQPSLVDRTLTFSSSEPHYLQRLPGLSVPSVGVTVRPCRTRYHCH